MLLNMLIFWYMLICGFYMFCYFHKHLLMTLLSLEYLVVVIFLLMFNYFMMFGNDFNFLIIFLTYSVCEGAMGLSILVTMIRTFGNDNLFNLNMLMW